MAGPPVGRPPPAVGRDSTADYACRGSDRCVRGRGFDSRRLHSSALRKPQARPSLAFRPSSTPRFRSATKHWLGEGRLGEPPPPSRYLPFSQMVPGGKSVWQWLPLHVFAARLSSRASNVTFWSAFVVGQDVAARRGVGMNPGMSRCRAVLVALVPIDGVVVAVRE